MGIIKKYYGFIFIILIGIIPLKDFLHSGIPITHDGKDHVARMANFYTSLSQGNIIPRWAGNLNWGYGHPILMFLYPLPSYIASFFHLVGFSFPDAFKLTFVFAYIASGVTMYLWIRKMLGDHPGIIAAILYMFAPYRFVDMFVRGDIGEHVAIAFAPLVFYALFSLFQAKSVRQKFVFTVFTGFSLALLILSHNAVSIMFLPAILGYMVYLFALKKNKEFLMYEVVSFVGGFVLSAFFWIPAYFEGKYTLRDIVTSGDAYTKSFVSLGRLLYGPWSYGISGEFSVQIGFLQIASLVIFPIVFYFIYKKTKQLAWLYTLFFLYALTGIFIMLPISNALWQHISLLPKFQFPWRFLTVVVFASSVMGGFVTYALRKKYQILIVVAVAILALFLNFPYFKAKGYLIKPESFYTGIYNGTTDTGESSPIWSTRFMGHRFKKPLVPIQGSAKITQEKRTFDEHLYLVKVVSASAQLRENTLYFPNWTLYVDNKKTGFQFQDPNNRGVMTFFVEKGVHQVEFIFKDTKLRTISDLLTLMGLVVCFMWGGYVFVKYNKP